MTEGIGNPLQVPAIMVQFVRVMINYANEIYNNWLSISMQNKSISRTISTDIIGMVIDKRAFDVV